MTKAVIFLSALFIVGVGAAISHLKRSDAVMFGGVSLKIEYAASSDARALGLGKRETLPKDAGMLFIFPKDDLYGFWMKDMHFPIDIFWLSDQGQVIDIDQNIDPATYPNVFYPQAPVRYVLEANAGFAKEHDIEEGTKLELKNIPVVSK